MQTILKSRILKPVVVFLLVLFLWLFFQLPIGRASTSHQTIPTAPPTTSATPTNTSTQTPTNTPQTTVTSTQTTYVLASQTPGYTTSPTVETMLTTNRVTWYWNDTHFDSNTFASRRDPGRCYCIFPPNSHCLPPDKTTRIQRNFILSSLWSDHTNFSSWSYMVSKIQKKTI